MLTVVKVGGSLYDLPDLRERLRDWLAAQPPGRTLLVPGGGAAADAVRELDRLHRLGDETAHWLALQTMRLGSHFLAALLGCPVVGHPDEAGALAALDGEAFARADEASPGRLPHAWAVTSDSVAARAAVVGRAGRLVLLKSVDVPADTDWAEAARRGWVDEHFARAVPAGLCVEAVRLR